MVLLASNRAWNCSAENAWTWSRLKSQRSCSRAPVETTIAEADAVLVMVVGGVHRRLPLCSRAGSIIPHDISLRLASTPASRRPVSVQTTAGRTDFETRTWPSLNFPRSPDWSSPDGAGSPSRCPQTIRPLLPCLGPPLASLTSGPPQRASIPVLALEAQPPTGLPSRPTCRGADPLQVLKTRGFADDSRQASPVRPVYNADQPITALKGTGIRTLGPSRTNRSFLRNGKLAPENFTTTLCTTVATPNSVAQLLVDNPLFDWCRLAARPSLLRNRRNTSSSVGTFGLRPSRSA